MPARRNKKRKGRNFSVDSRTLDTLTLDDSAFVVPLPSCEENPTHLMSSPFSVTSSSGGNNQAGSFIQVPIRFALPYSYNMQQQPLQQRQDFYHHASMLPPGKNDLEVLENLKTMIKEGQHEIFRAHPKPAVLASLYLGPRTGLSQVPPHPKQIVGEHRTPHLNQPGHDDSPDSNNLSSDIPRRASPDSHSQCLDNNNNETPSPISAGPKQHDASSVLGNSDSSSTVDIKPASGQPEVDSPRNVAGTSSGPVNSTDDDVNNNDGPPSVTEREGEYNAKHPRDTSPSKSACDAKDNSRLPRDNSWSRSDTPSDNRSARHGDRLAYPPPRSTFDSRGNGNDSRILPGNRAPFDRDRDRELDRDRGRDWERDRERPRDRRPEFFGRSYGRSHAPRPPPELRHYEPDYSSDYVPRRHDSRDMDPDRRGGHRNGSHDDLRRAPLDDRRFPTDERPSRALLTSSPDHHNRGRSLDNRPIALSGTDSVTQDRPIRLPMVSDNTVPVTRPGPDERSRLLTGEDRGPRVPPPTEQRSTRPPVPLEERISQSVPSLQDRLSQPVLKRVDNPTGRHPSLEERLSLAPLPAAMTSSVAAPPTAVTDRTLPDDRGGRSGTIDTPRTTDRSADTRSATNGMFSRPSTPPLSRKSSYVPPARAPSVARDDHRVPPPSSKDAIPPVGRSDVRDFHASRDLSRERPAPPYRPDVNRSFGDNRDRAIMDVDAPVRLPDTRGPLLRRFSPPPPPPGDRARAYYAPRSPPRDTFDAGDRRYAPADRDAFDRRRDWYVPPATGTGTDDDKRPMWRYDRPPIDRDQKDRFDHWDEREDERERERRRERERDRDRRFPSPPQPRSLSSRLTDPYPPAGADHRTYPPATSARDYERYRYIGGDTSPPLSRVRARSPSPPRRAGVDDRPPMKRLRGDIPPSYTSGVGGTGSETGVPYLSSTTYPPTRRTSSVAGEYGARSAVGTPPPSSGATSSLYDSRGPPPFSGGSVTGDREFGYGNAYGSAYEREVRRTPPPSSRMPPPYGRGTYVRGNDPREDRRYIPHPRPPRAT